MDPAWKTIKTKIVQENLFFKQKPNPRKILEGYELISYNTKVTKKLKMITSIARLQLKNPQTYITG